MLRVSMVGNLGADPEMRYSQKGSALASFRVAANQVRTSPEGDRQESTEWFRVRAGGRLAEFAQRLGKGSRVLVVGRLEISRYQSREGDPRVGFEIWADEVVNLSSRAAGADGEEQPEPSIESGETPVAPVIPPTERRVGVGAHGSRRAVASAAARRPGLVAVGGGRERTGATESESDLPL